MIRTTEFRDELLALKVDATHLLGTAADKLLKPSREHGDEFAGQLNSALQELVRNLAREEQQIGRLVRERPIVALASAFAVGIVAGCTLRRI